MHSSRLAGCRTWDAKPWSQSIIRKALIAQTKRQTKDQKDKKIFKKKEKNDTIEAMKEDKAVYRAVRAAIMAAHQEDGVTVADIVRETEEQKQAGRIKYLVAAEEWNICPHIHTADAGQCRHEKG